VSRVATMHKAVQEVDAIRRSVIGAEAAIAAATYHRDSATSPLLVRYWNAVIVSLGGEA
jgi:hypothetical protein